MQGDLPCMTSSYCACWSVVSMANSNIHVGCLSSIIQVTRKHREYDRAIYLFHHLLFCSIVGIHCWLQSFSASSAWHNEVRLWSHIVDRQLIHFFRIGELKDYNHLKAVNWNADERSSWRPTKGLDHLTEFPNNELLFLWKIVNERGGGGF